MKLLWRIKGKVLAVVAAVFMPLFAYAHEVYVLSPKDVAADIANQSPNPFLMAVKDFPQFFLWATVGVVLVSAVFLISIWRPVEKAVDPFLMKLKRFAPLVARITFGLSLLASAYYGDLFGPELTMVGSFDGLAAVTQVVLYILSILIILGLFTRIASFVVVLMYVWMISIYGTYMLTYINYLGEAILFLLLGGHLWSLDHLREKDASKIGQSIKRRLRKMEPYSFLILRVLFGIAIMYASYYAKILHSQLALDTVTNYHLTNYFHFAPLFLVLGAATVEMLVGLFFIFGVEIRFTAIFFLIFLFLSLGYFGEVVWPHLILIGINLTFICHGYDKYSVEGRFFKKRLREPVF